jgi:hypothetical protein
MPARKGARVSQFFEACRSVVEQLESRIFLTSAPTVTTVGSSQTATTATLLGTINANGSTTSARFQYSTNSSFTSVITTLGSGFNQPYAIATDTLGDIFLADTGNDAVKEILPNGSIATIGSGFSAPSGVAVDAAGDVFVADYGNNVVKEVVAVNGSIPVSPTIETIGSGFSGPSGVAVDAAGDVFVADSNNNVVKEVQAKQSKIVTVAAGFNYPTAVALDSSGDVYVLDYGNSAIKEVVAVSGSIPTNPTINTIGSGFSFPAGLAVDSKNNVFVSDYGNGVVTEVPANGGIPYTLSVGVTEPLGIAVDALGDLFVSDANLSSQIVELAPPTVFAMPVDVSGSTATAISASLSGLTAGTPYYFRVVASGPTGVAYSAYATFTTTSVTPTLTTTAASGVTSTSATINATVNPAGSLGVPAFQYSTSPSFSSTITPVLQTLRSNLSQPGALAVDASGDIFVPESYHPSNGTSVNSVVEFKPDGTAVTVATDLNYPTAVAVDTSGDLFVAEDPNFLAGGQGDVLEILPNQVIKTIASGLDSPTSLAVDAAGDVFVADNFGQAVDELLPSSAIKTIGSGYSYPSGVAVDSSGDVFVADFGNNQVKEVLPNGTINTIGSGFSGPIGVAVDTLGDVFVAESDNQIKEIVPGNTVKDLLQVYQPGGVAVDSLGNVYTALNSGGASGGSVIELGYPLTRASPPTVSGTGTTSFSATISGLTPNTVYYYRSIVHTSIGFTFGPVNSLLTSAPPIVTTGNAAGIASSSATVFGALNAQGSSANAFFQYSTSSSFAPTVTTSIGSAWSNPTGVAVDAAGDVFIADTSESTIEEFLSSGAIQTIGSGFVNPTGVAVDALGDVFVADTGNSAIKEVVAVNGIIPASPTIKTLGSGFSHPTGVAVDAGGDTVAVADLGNNAVKEILPNNTVQTLGTALNTKGVAMDSAGDVYITDAVTGLVHEIEISGSSVETLLIGSGFSQPDGLTVDAAGDVLVAEAGGNDVKELRSGTITTVASGFNSPTGVALDGLGNLIVADDGNKRIVKTSPPTIAANPSPQSGTSVARISAALTGLAAGTTYYYRAIGLGSGGDSIGSTGSFVTGTANPVVTAGTSTITLGSASPNNVTAGPGLPSYGVVGSGFNAAANQSDSAGTRVNIDTAHGITLPAGTYTASSFDFTASQSGDVQPALFVLSSGTIGSGQETYTAIAVGDDTAVTTTGNHSIAFSATPANDLFTVPVGGETVYEGFSNVSGPNPVGQTSSGAPVVQFNPGGSLFVGENAYVYSDHLTPQQSGTWIGGPGTQNNYLYREYAADIRISATGVGALTSVLQSDSLGTRLNIDTAHPIALAAGTYTAATFDFTATQVGDVQPALFVVSSGTIGSGSEVYTAVAVGDDTTVTTTGNQSIAFSANPANETFTVPGGGETVYEGFSNLTGPNPVGFSNTGAVAGAQFNPGGSLSVGENAYENTATSVEGVHIGGTGAATYELPRSYAADIRIIPPVATQTSAALTGTVNPQGGTDGVAIQYSAGANFLPSVLTTIGSGFTAPQAVALDAAGDVYLANAGSHAIQEVLLNGTIKTIATTTNIPRSLAVDSSGDVFDVETGSNLVKEYLTNGTVNTIGSGFFDPDGVAVDSAGDVFIADTGNSLLKEVLPSGVIVTLGSGFTSPTAVALDSSGDVFIVNSGNSAIDELLSSGTLQTLGSGFNAPYGLAVDGLGDVFVSEPTNNLVQEILPNQTVVTVGSGFSTPIGLAADATGDVYIADSGNARVASLSVPLAAAKPPTVSGNSATAISGTATGLFPNTLYYFRTVATSASGTFVSGSSFHTPKFSPVLATTATQSTNVVGSAVQQDSAVLTGGYAESGTITFTLTAPDGTTSTIATDVVTSNGTYTATATAVEIGTYTWHASYSGDSNNNAAPDPATSSQKLTVIKASPTLSPTASLAQPAGFPEVLQDSAVLAGGYIETGNITFTLTAPDSTTSTYTDAVIGTGTYRSPRIQATEVGTYTWSAAYTGDGLNNAIAPQSAANQQSTTTQAPPQASTSTPTVTATTATLNGMVNPEGASTAASFQVSAEPYFLPTNLTDFAPELNQYNSEGYDQLGANDVAVNAGGSVFLTNYANYLYNNFQLGSETEAWKFTSDSNETQVYLNYGGGQLPDGIAVDLLGHLDITEGNNLNGSSSYGLLNPSGVAVDLAGNIFVADTGNNAVKEIQPNGTILTIGSGFNAPKDVALDANGDVFVADTGNNAIKEVLTNGTIKTLATGLQSPWGVAVDTVGDVYFTENGNGNVDELTLDGNTHVLASGLSGVRGIAVSNVGNVYVAEYNTDQVIQLAPQTIAATTSPGSGLTPVAVSGLATGLIPGTTYYYRAVATNGVSGALGAYASFTTSLATATLVSTAQEAGSAVGSAVLQDSAVLTSPYSPTGTITFTLTAPDGTTSTVGSVPVSSNGTYTSPTVTANEVGTYTWHASYGGDTHNNKVTDQQGAAEQSIVVKASPTITATASQTGLQVGSPVLQDSAALAGGFNPSGTLTFSLTAPDGTTSTIGTVTVNGDNTYVSPTVTPNEVGIYTWHANYNGDGFNNTTADQGGVNAQEIVRGTPLVTTTAATAVSTSQATLNGTVNPIDATATPSFQYSTTSAFAPTVQTTTNIGAVEPLGVAADLFGNVFVADNPGGKIIELLANGTKKTFASLNQPLGVAVDAADDVFVLSFNGSTESEGITEILANGTTRSIVSSSDFQAIAADAAGDVYATDPSGQDVQEFFAGGGSRTIGSGILSPAGLAVDKSGNVYVGDQSYGRVDVIHSDGTNAGAIGSGLSSPEGVATDAAGDVFVTDSSGLHEIAAAGGQSLVSGISGTGVAVDPAGRLFLIGVQAGSVTELAPASIAAIPATITGSTASPISATLTSLTPGTTYYYRAVATALGGIGVGNVVSFSDSTVSPTLTSTASETAGGAVGSALLSDSAVLAGGFDPSGSITFTLTAPDQTTSTISTVTVNGSGTYPSPTVVATEVGTYTWHASYSGDASNNPSSDQGGTAEQLTTIKASPSVTTTASQTNGGQVGSAVLSDSAVLTGGDQPTGAITFTLKAPDGTTSTIGVVTVSGDGTYAPPTVVATELGTYTWYASYGGDTLDNGAGDQLSSAEQTTTVQASPTLTSTASATNASVVQSAVMSDSAVLAGGDNPTGTITFTLTQPDGSTITIGSVTSTGDGTYSSPTVLATEVGTYTWHASYGGNTLNDMAQDQADALEVVSIVKASPTLVTSASDTNGGLVNFAVLSDSAALTGGFSPTGTITFTLAAPDGTTSTIGSVSVSNDGTYTSPTVTGTELGTYQWHATYNGDSFNATAADEGGSAESSQIVATALPIVTTGTATAVTGTSASLSGTVNSLNLSATTSFQYSASPSFPPSQASTLMSVNQPLGVAIDSEGDVYSANRGISGNPGITERLVNGTTLSIYSGSVNEGIAVDSAGDVYFSTGGGYFTSNPGALHELIPNSNGYTDTTVATGLDGPEGIAVDASDNVYVAENGGNNVVEFYAHNGGSKNNYFLFNLLQGIAVDSAGDLFACNSQNEIREVTPSGAITDYRGFNYPEGVAVDKFGDIFVAARGSVTEILPNGDRLAISSGSTNSSLGVAVDPSGDLFVADYDDNRIEELTTPSVTATPPSLNSIAATPISATLTGLTPNTTYYFRTVASDSTGTSYGPAVSFTTVSAAPTITTTQQPASAAVGTAIADQATVIGGYNPTGTVTFNLYNNSTASGTPLFTDTETLSGGTATSKGYTTTALGTDYWVATYNGDTNNNATATPNSAEPVTISQAQPTLTTTASGSLGHVVGSSILSDSASLTGGDSPTGTLTFTLTKPDSTTSSFAVTVNGDGVYSAPTVLATEVGTYTWQASYGGDTLNNAATDPGGASEKVSTVKSTPTLIATASRTNGGVLGNTYLSDSAVLSGGYLPSGTITFTLKAPDGTTSTIGSAKVTGDGTFVSASVYATEAGVYTWQANYGGDSLNNAVRDQGGSADQLTTTQAAPTLSASASESAGNAAGTATLSDAAVLAGGFNPTGTITFTLTAPDGTTSTIASDTVSGNGTYTAPSVPAVEAGTYSWHASYSGDAANFAAGDGSLTYGANGSVQSYAVPTTGSYYISLAGAQGGSTPYNTGGSGAVLSGSILLTTGTLYQVVVAGAGGNTHGNGAPGGGGGSFVFVYGASLPLIVAGGGGGASFAYSNRFNGGDAQLGTSGAPGTGAYFGAGGSGGNGGSGGSYGSSDGGGGAGWLSGGNGNVEGGTGGLGGDNRPSFAGGAGGTYGDSSGGGYGGGGGGGSAGGGGGGYSGGGGGGYTGGGGGGGGSYFDPSFTDETSVARETGDGFFSITPGQQTLVVVSAATIATTQQPASAVVGGTIADQATISGGDNPTGTVTFDLYRNSAATGTPLFVDTETLSGGTATSNGYTTTATGTDYWVATYNGDSNNAAVTSPAAAEPVTITSLAPTISTTQQPTSAAVGTSIADQATVSGGYSPAGTVTFVLYNNSTGTGTPLFTDTETLFGGTATSKSFTTSATGTDYWVDTYNGDANNSAVTSGSAAEPVTITSVTPTISTAQQPASTSAGNAIADQATISGGFNPTGTVTFNLYNNSTATGTPLFTDTETLSGGTATSGSFTTTATGTDYWVDTYNGDTNNNAVTSAPAAEPVSITATTATISTTQQPASATVGKSIADKATVSGGSNPTGTVTFNLYNNSTATGTPLFTDTERLSGGVATSKGYTTTSIGTDYWVDTYNGDSNNAAVTSAAAAEPVTIIKANPTITTTQQPASAPLGTLIADKATVSGGDSPTGTVTFNLYNNSTATGTPLFTDTETLVGGTAISQSYSPAAAGQDYWVVTYNGDGNNFAVTSSSTSEPVAILSRPTLSATASIGAASGSVILSDTATLSGGSNPTGKINFSLTAPDGSTISVGTVTVHGDGSYTSPDFTPTEAGAYIWQASYGGDAFNEAAGDGSSTLGYTGAVQTYTVPSSGSYFITLAGAQGGTAYTTNSGTINAGGLGAVLSGADSLTAGTTYQVVVAGAGADAESYYFADATGGGGGGGSFVFISGADQPLVVAGGGGGATVATDGTDAQTGTSGSNGGDTSYSTGGGGGALGDGGSGGSAGEYDGGGGAGWESAGSGNGEGETMKPSLPRER